LKPTPSERWVSTLCLCLGGILMVLPFYYMLVTSFKSNAEAAAPVVSLMVKEPTVKPYTDLVEGGLILGATWNSFLIALPITFGSMFFCLLAGYAFAKHRFPGRDALFLLLLSTMMIPGAVLLVPSFLLFRDLGWLDTWLPLIVPGVAGAFGVFLARQFVSKIPDSLIESAKIEGCGEWRIFRSIIMPLSKPVMATLAILTFLGSWNSFIGPLIILLDEKKYTLPLVVAMLQGRFPGNENIQMAGAMVSILPVLIFFFLFQRQIVQSLASSGLKEG
jgi:multiple sugar transport system permease protein